MNRKFLEDLGIEKEAIEKIMAEHGKSIQAEKAETQSKIDEVNQIKQQLTELQNEKDQANMKANADKYSQLQKEYEELQKEKETAENALKDNKINNAIEWGLSQAGAKNIALLSKSIDRSKLELTDDGINGLDEQIQAFKESDGYLFKDESEPKQEENGKPQFSFSGNNQVNPDEELTGFDKLMEKYKE